MFTYSKKVNYQKYSYNIAIQVCDDIDECKGPDNGGCTKDSICENTMVRLLHITLYVYSRQLFHLCNFEVAFQITWWTLCISAQGSFHCGTCKTGFTGDQVKGCKPEISCGNSLTNPCDINAQCAVERDGSVSCQVRFHLVMYYLHTNHI